MDYALHVSLYWVYGNPHDKSVMTSKNSDRIPAVTTVIELDALPSDTEAVLVKGLSDDLAHAIGRLRALRFLHTDGSDLALTDLGLQALGELVSLESLDLEWAALSDTGLHHLTSLINLRWLNLGFSRGISANGLAALRSVLPNCEVDVDGAWLPPSRQTHN